MPFIDVIARLVGQEPVITAKNALIQSERPAIVNKISYLDYFKLNTSSEMSPPPPHGGLCPGGGPFGGPSPLVCARQVAIAVVNNHPINNFFINSNSCYFNIE